MLTNEPTTKLPEIYSSEEFLAKYHQVTQAPTGTIQYAGQFLMHLYETESKWPTDAKEDDPLNLLPIIESAKNGNADSIILIIGSLNDIRGGGDNPPTTLTRQPSEVRLSGRGGEA